MKALILTGGLGTRLRPLTCTVPKPLLPVVNSPFITVQIENLRRHGIREVILASGYKAAMFRKALGDGRGLGVSIRYVSETTPLGTGGGVRNAAHLLDAVTVILNGDVLQNIDISDFLKNHKKNKAEISILLARVEDPTLYGLVETDHDGRIRRFLEKPSPEEITCDTINAGAYIFEPRLAEEIPPGVPYSLERALFPEMLRQRRRLFGFVTQGYWLDIGTTDKYHQAHMDILSGAAPFSPLGSRRAGPYLKAPGSRVGPGSSHDGAGRVLLGRGTIVSRSVSFSGPVSVGDGCRIGDGARLSDCVVLHGTEIGKGARIEGCVIGNRCRIGEAASVGPGRVLGDGTRIAPYSKS